MHRKKPGIETNIRTQKAPHLLNIHGGMFYTAINCAKKLQNHLEILSDNIYFDLKSTILNMKYFF